MRFLKRLMTWLNPPPVKREEPMAVIRLDSDVFAIVPLGEAIMSRCDIVSTLKRKKRK